MPVGVVMEGMVNGVQPMVGAMNELIKALSEPFDRTEHQVVSHYSSHPCLVRFVLVALFFSTCVVSKHHGHLLYMHCLCSKYTILSKIMPLISVQLEGASLRRKCTYL